MQKFKYAGHTLEVNLLPQSHGEFHIELKSLKAEPIEHGTYPAHFAEEEANDTITNLVMTYKDLDPSNALSVMACVNRAIRSNIENGIFGAVN